MKTLHIGIGLVTALVAVCGLWAGMGFAFKLAFRLFMFGWDMV